MTLYRDFSGTRTRAARLFIVAQFTLVVLGAFGVVAAPAAAQGIYPGGFSRIAFQDEFNGSSLDRSAWCTRLPNGDTSQPPKPPYADPECQIGWAGRGDHYDTSKEQQRYREVDATGALMHVVGGGTLKLRSVSRVVTEGVPADTYDRFDSSIIRSKFKFVPKLGIQYMWTQRLKLPDVVGTFPAGWLHSGPDARGETDWPPEIDLFEAPRNRSGQQANSVHMAAVYGPMQNPQPPNPQCIDQSPPCQATYDGGKSVCYMPCFTYVRPAFDRTWHNYYAERSLKDAFINFSLVWDENEICYYIDNDKIKCEIYHWRTSEGKIAKPAQLILNMAIGGTWAGSDGIDDFAWAKDNGNNGSVDIELDYVRVFWRAPGDPALKVVRAGKL